VKKIATFALSLLTCVALVNMIGCRKTGKPKTANVVEKQVDAECADIKNLNVKEAAELE